MLLVGLYDFAHDPLRRALTKWSDCSAVPVCRLAVKMKGSPVTSAKGRGYCVVYAHELALSSLLVKKEMSCTVSAV